MFTQQIQKEWTTGRKDLWSRKFGRIQHGEHGARKLSTLNTFNALRLNILVLSWQFENMPPKYFLFQLDFDLGPCIFVEKKNNFLLLDYDGFFVKKINELIVNIWIKFKLYMKITCQIITLEGYCIVIAANSCHLFLSIDRSIKNRNKKQNKKS